LSGDIRLLMLANDRCNQENLLAQLSGRVRALSAPVDNLLSNRAYMVMAALATRIVGEVTPQRLESVRQATAVVEEELGETGAFQYLAVLLNDRATGIRDNQREFGQIIVVRCIESTDARTATATELPWSTLHRVCRRIVTEIPDVNRCLYDLTPKPPATVEYV